MAFLPCWLPAFLVKSFHSVWPFMTGPNEPDPEFTEDQLAEQAKQAALEAVYQTMADEIAKPLQMDINGATYFMDARDDSASRFQGGIELAGMLGETEMQMVDYYNNVHVVSLEDALEICKQ
jgi:hypothetical protein